MRDLFEQGKANTGLAGEQVDAFAAHVRNHVITIVPEAAAYHPGAIL